MRAHSFDTSSRICCCWSVRAKSIRRTFQGRNAWAIFIYPAAAMPGRVVMSNSLYDRDFYAWANQQAALLRAGRLAEADIANIAEEIESMGRSEKRELINRLIVVLTHL